MPTLILKKSFEGHRGRPGIRGGSLPRGILTNPYKLAGIPYAPKSEHIKSYEQMIEHDWKDPQTRHVVVLNAVNNVQNYCNAGVVATRVPVDAAFKILQDGRFKSQFETGNSTGAFDPTMRTRIENQGFGVPDYMESNRPIYGYVDGPYESQVAYHGNVEFVFNNIVKDRTTITVGDSFDNQIWSPINRVQPCSIEPYHMGYIAKSANPVSDVAYVEAQIHGGVKLKDVSYVIFHKECYYADGTNRMMPSVADLETAFKAKGIKVVHDPTHY